MHWISFVERKVKNAGNFAVTSSKWSLELLFLISFFPGWLLVPWFLKKQWKAHSLYVRPCRETLSSSPKMYNSLKCVEIRLENFLGSVSGRLEMKWILTCSFRLLAHIHICRLVIMGSHSSSSSYIFTFDCSSRFVSYPTKVLFFFSEAVVCYIRFEYNEFNEIWWAIFM